MKRVSYTEELSFGGLSCSLRLLQQTLQTRPAALFTTTGSWFRNALRCRVQAAIDLVLLRWPTARSLGLYTTDNIQSSTTNTPKLVKASLLCYSSISSPPFRPARPLPPKKSDIVLRKRFLSVDGYQTLQHSTPLYHLAFAHFAFDRPNLPISKWKVMASVSIEVA